MINTLFLAAAVEPTFAAFLYYSQTYVQASRTIFQISLKNSELKATHNTFRDYRVPFLEAVYIK